MCFSTTIISFLLCQFLCVCLFSFSLSYLSVCPLVEFSLSPTFGTTFGPGRFTLKHSFSLQNRLFSLTPFPSLATLCLSHPHKHTALCLDSVYVAHTKASLNSIACSFLVHSVQRSEKQEVYIDVTLLCSEGSLCSCLLHQASAHCGWWNEQGGKQMLGSGMPSAAWNNFRVERNERPERDVLTGWTRRNAWNMLDVYVQQSLYVCGARLYRCFALVFFSIILYSIIGFIYLFFKLD